MKSSMAMVTASVLTSLSLSAPAAPPVAAPAKPAAGPAGPAQPAVRANFARQLGTSLADAIEKSMPSVVVIKVARFVKQAIVDPNTKELRSVEGMAIGQGSGSFLSSEGHILTSFHVVDGRKVEIAVATNDGKVHKGEIVGVDPKTDLAVIKIAVPEGTSYPVIETTDSDALRIGEIVIALGAPLGLDKTATFGILSQKGRDVGKLAFESFLQTDASINPGTSGGPVVDADGRMVGVSAMIQTTGEGAGNIGIGFVVPSSVAMKVARTLMTRGQMVRSFIGIAPEQMVPSQTPLPPGLSEAVRIAKVTEGSPADTAGLKTGDIVLKVDDHLTPTLHEIKKYMHTHEPGDVVKFVVVRDGKEVSIEVKAGEAPKS